MLHHNNSLNVQCLKLIIYFLNIDSTIANKINIRKNFNTFYCNVINFEKYYIQILNVFKKINNSIT